VSNITIYYFIKTTL